MSAARLSGRKLALLLAAAGALALIGANAHLVYVALASQPDCVAHIKRGAGAGHGTYAAARSAC